MIFLGIRQTGCRSGILEVNDFTQTRKMIVIK